MKPDSVPPTAVMSLAVNWIVASLSVKVMVAVSPILRLALLLLIATVGAIVSIAIGVASEPATLPLPAVSVNALAATEMVPEAVEVAAGVNVAE